MRRDRPAPMTVAHFESIVCKCAGQIERGFARLHFAVRLCAREAGSEQEDRQEDWQAASHLASVLFWIASITLPTASFTLRTSSTLGALLAGKETSFSMPTSCSFTSLTSGSARSEEHTSELQSRGHLVCRLLLEKKKKQTNNI